jgi:hypothetical protein
MSGRFDSTPTAEERADARQFVQNVARSWSGVADRELRTILVRSDVLVDLQAVVDGLGDGCDRQQARRIARAKALVAELDEWNRQA